MHTVGEADIGKLFGSLGVIRKIESGGISLDKGAYIDLRNITSVMTLS